jgi:hypothetical protein
MYGMKTKEGKRWLTENYAIQFLRFLHRGRGRKEKTEIKTKIKVEKSEIVRLKK